MLAQRRQSNSDGRDIEGGSPAEIWNPDTETWTTVASLKNGRQYHSTALLLPDGRVLMAGGGAAPGPARPTAERRDLLAAVPLQGRAADDHVVAGERGLRRELRRHDAGRGADREGLADPVAVGHARVRPEPALPVPQLHGRLGQGHGQAPATANLAPPGDYMLFLVDSNGVPSVGSFVRAVGSGDTTPPTAPTSLTATPSARTGRAHLGRLDRQRRGREVQRLSLDHVRVHAEHRATGSPSPRARATPTRPARPAPTTTRSPPTTSPATRARLRTR